MFLLCSSPVFFYDQFVKRHFPFLSATLNSLFISSSSSSFKNTFFFIAKRLLRCCVYKLIISTHSRVTSSNWVRLRMAGFASQAALRSHYEDIIDETEEKIVVKLSSAFSWFNQVVLRTTEKKVPCCYSHSTHKQFSSLPATRNLHLYPLANVAHDLTFLIRFSV